MKYYVGDYTQVRRHTRRVYRVVDIPEPDDFVYNSYVIQKPVSRVEKMYNPNDPDYLRLAFKPFV